MIKIGSYCSGMVKFIRVDIIILAILFFVCSVFLFKVQAAQSPTSPYSISGYIFTDNSHNGLKEKGETGVPNILVNVKDTKDTWSVVKTDSSGYYSYPAFQSGVYTVSITTPPNAILTTTQKNSTYYLSADSRNVTVNFGMIYRVKNTSQVSFVPLGGCGSLSNSECFDEYYATGACTWDYGSCIDIQSKPDGASCQYDNACSSPSGCVNGHCGGGTISCQAVGDQCCAGNTCTNGLVCTYGYCAQPAGGGTGGTTGGGYTVAQICASVYNTTVCATNDQICTTDPRCVTSACNAGYTESNGQCCPNSSPYYCAATGYCYADAPACTAATGGGNTGGGNTNTTTCNGQDNYFDCAATSEGGVPCVYDEGPQINQGSQYVCFKEGSLSQGTACNYDQSCSTNNCVNNPNTGYSVCATAGGGNTGGTCDSISDLSTCQARNDCYVGFSAGANRCIARIDSGGYCQVPGSDVCTAGNSCIAATNGSNARCCPAGQTNNGTQCTTGTTGGGTPNLQLQLLPATPPDGIVNKPYSQITIWLFDVTNNEYLSGNQLTVTQTSGNLPPGITAHISNAGQGYVIDGTPTAAGVYVFWLHVCKAGTTFCKDANLSIIVNNDTGGGGTNPANTLGIVANPFPFPSGRVGTAYPNVTLSVISGQLNRNLNPSEITWSNPNFPANAFPQGIVFNQATDQITGTPSQAGTFNPFLKACSTASNECGTILMNMVITSTTGSGSGSVTVQFLQPTEGTTIGTTTAVKVQATTNTPQGTIKSIKICVDDLNGNDCATIPATGLTQFGNVSQGQVQFDPKDETNGPHKFLAQATDNVSQTGQSQINFTVKNGTGPTPTPTKTGPTPTATPGGGGNPTATPGGGGNPTATPGGGGNPTATPTAVASCNKACSAGAGCPDGYSCLNSVCRANSCLADTTCSCVAPTATPTVPAGATATPTLPAGVTVTATPTLPAGVTATPSPTLPPGVTPTASPTPTQGVGVTPTVTITPTPVITTQFKVSVTLPGIGSRPGDNNAPKHTTRDAEIFIYNTKAAQVAHGEGTVEYTNGIFTGTLPVTGLTSGSYTVAVKVDNTLQSPVSAKPLAITAGQQVILPKTELVSGDFNNDNQLGVSDYNIIISCFGNKLCARKQDADLNDDGQVEEKDLNILIRGFAIQL